MREVVHWRHAVARIARFVFDYAGLSREPHASRTRARRMLRCGLFVCASAGFAAPAVLHGPPLGDRLSIVAGILVVVTAPFPIVRRVMGRSDNVYTALASVGGAAAVLGGVVLHDSASARVLDVLSVLLLVPAVIGPCSTGQSASKRLDGA